MQKWMVLCSRIKNTGLQCLEESKEVQDMSKDFSFDGVNLNDEVLRDAVDADINDGGCASKSDDKSA